MAEKPPAPSATDDPDSALESDNQAKRSIGLKSSLTLALALLITIGVAGWWYWDSLHYARTDAAYAHADIVPVTTPVEGLIETIEARENVRVEAGDLLVLLDLEDARIARSRGQAELTALQAAIESAKTLVDAEQATVAESAAELASSQAEKARVDADLNRFRNLADQGWVTKQALETAEADARKAAAAVARARAE
ncbi:MAG: hypothetical protein AAGK01_01930, partial [Pseudomonadota bacterium]